MPSEIVNKLLLEAEPVSNLFQTEYPLFITGSQFKTAIPPIVRAMQHVISTEGILALKKQPHQINAPMIVRALVMLRCLYEYELDNGIGNAPSQDKLCNPKDYSGLLSETYRKLELDKAGFLTDHACRGAPHVQAAAHLLSSCGLLAPRGRRPYFIEKTGRLLAFYLFGDRAFMTSRNVMGWTGIPPLSNTNGRYEISWLVDFLKLSEGF